MQNYHEHAADLIEEVFEYVKGSGLYKQYMSDKQFEESWELVLGIVKANKDKRNRRAATTKTILKHWVDEEARKWIEGSDLSTTFLTLPSRGKNYEL